VTRRAARLSCAAVVDAQPTPADAPRVLIVEDDEDVRAVLAEVLEAHGFEVWLARNGREALDSLHAGRLPDAIFLDLSMPVMNGFEFREAQRRDPALAVIPTVVLSAASRLRERTAALDVAEVVAKPLGVDELVAVARRWTRRRRR
jgi:CheY-like chemotaxis protein